VSDPALAWHFHPDVWAMIVALAGGYVLALRVWGPRYAAGRPTARRRHKILFAAGIAALAAGSEWPIHQLSAQLFTVHMLQHMLFSLVAAPLLILGTPGWLFRRLFRPRLVFAVVRFLTQPLIALLVFNAWLAAYHWPALVNLSIESHLAHFAVHVLFVVTALIMWWPVLSPLPELPHLSYAGRGAYLFAQSIVPTVPASFLTFSHTALYAAYDIVPRLWGVSVLDDQQWAGLLMKIGGGLILWGVIAVIFFRWAAAEERGGPDHLYWRDMEPELELESSTQT
jgi:putative membrane protein